MGNDGYGSFDLVMAGNGERLVADRGKEDDNNDDDTDDEAESDDVSYDDCDGDGN